MHFKERRAEEGKPFLGLFDFRLDTSEIDSKHEANSII